MDFYSPQKPTKSVHMGGKEDFHINLSKISLYRPAVILKENKYKLMLWLCVLVRLYGGLE